MATTPVRPSTAPLPGTATLPARQPIRSGPGRVHPLLAKPVVGVGAAGVLALALRLPFVAEPAYPDEGGYLLAARSWASAAGPGPVGDVPGDLGGGLYGDLWVDRPPLLLLFWRAVDAAGGIVTARLVACGLVVALVIFAGWAVLAGLTAALAVVTKQNFSDGVVFALVLVAGSWMSRSLSARTAITVLGGAAVGAGVVATAALWWASTTEAGIAGLWYVLYGFRADAFLVVFTHSLAAPMSRLGILATAAVGTGLAIVLMTWVAAVGRMRRSDPTQLPLLAAVGAMLGVALGAVALGASYWVHYLVGLVPVAALAIGMLAGQARSSRSGGARWPARRPVGLVVCVVTAAVIASVLAGPLTEPSRQTEAAVATTLRTAARPADTVFIAYGHPNVVQEAGVWPAYPYLWSLSMRTLDPHLSELRRTLSGQHAPTWVVQWNDIDSWDIDPDGRVAAILRQRYQPTETVCGVQVLLRRDAVRAVTNVTAHCPTDG
ncbi:MAG: hypothetical protein K0Q93_118 [Nocardioidaceae bacterium]|nr:hypothetical protein [Nocardioidaceae bacterium]